MSAIPSAFDQRFQQREAEPVEYPAPVSAGIDGALYVENHGFQYLVGNNKILIMRDWQAQVEYDVGKIMQLVAGSGGSQRLLYVGRQDRKVRALYFDSANNLYLSIVCEKIDCTYSTEDSVQIDANSIGDNKMLFECQNRDYVLAAKDRSLAVIYFDESYVSNYFSLPGTIVGMDQQKVYYVVREAPASEGVLLRRMVPMYKYIQCSQTGITLSESEHAVDDFLLAIRLLLVLSGHNSFVWDGRLYAYEYPEYAKLYSIKVRTI